MTLLASGPVTAGDRQPTVSVVLLNDYEVVVRGLEQMLAPHAGRITVTELDFNMPVAQPVDVTLYDTFSQPQVDGEDIDRVLRSAWAGRVVVYTWNTHQDLVSTALSKGVAGYLSKRLSGEDLVTALERVKQGEIVVLTGNPDDAAGSWPDPDPDGEITAGDWPGRQEGLSAREAEVVALIAQGVSNQEIAERSYLSINSVKSYIRAAYRKMGVDSRTKAVLWGMEHGLAPERGRIVRTDDEPS
jgi:DNA-binding NarL/FixJ family response regulator